MPKKKSSKSDQKLQRRRSAARAYFKKLKAAHKKLEMELKKMSKCFKNPGDWWFGA
jgi:hypothetical protein